MSNKEVLLDSRGYYSRVNSKKRERQSLCRGEKGGVVGVSAWDWLHTDGTFPTKKGSILLLILHTPPPTPPRGQCRDGPDSQVTLTPFWE